MPRYVIQPHDMTCAPVAILNACKWVGKKTTLKHDYWRLCLDTECEPGQGTKIKNINRVLRNEMKGFAKVKRLWHPSLWRMEDHLLNGGSMLFSYMFHTKEDSGGHIAFFSETREGWFLGHNVIDTVCNSWLPRVEMLDMVYKIDRRWGYPAVWLLTRENFLA